MIPKMDFGSTGHASTRVIFGGYALSNATQQEADRTLALLREYGINHIDVARMYGHAEERIGPWMAKHRGDFFLATKTRKRTRQEAWEDLQRSLEMLRVEQIDLWQLHGLTNPGGWGRVMGPGGALEAMLEAREKGLVRFLGVTGHGSPAPKMHRQSLERFEFASVLLPYSYWQMHPHGMAKRFGVAQAFLGTPELVLLDETTEGLDPRNAHTVRQMIRAMAGRSAGPNQRGRRWAGVSVD